MLTFAPGLLPYLRMIWFNFFNALGRALTFLSTVFDTIHVIKKVNCAFFMFSALFLLTEQGFCDFTARSTESTKEWYFTSPNFDPSDPVNYAEYPLDTTCTYTLIAKHDQVVDVKFTYVNIDGIVPQ